MKKIFLTLLIITIFNIKMVHASGTYVMPMPYGSYSISSEFGTRIHPVSGEVSFHNGIDLGADIGVDVFASTSGTAYVDFDEGGGGTYIRVVQSDGDYTMYMHLSETMVTSGSSVNAGQTIAKVGNTGISTGPHLHFSVNRGGQFIDPRAVLDFNSKPTLPNNPISTYFRLEESHTTGQITVYVQGYFPIKVYKSTNNQEWELKTILNANYFSEYGLTNGTTYYYKIEDVYGREYMRRYTPPYTNIQINPLSLTTFEDDFAHVKWSEVKEDVHLYLNGSEIFHSTDGTNEYTLTALQPNTEYKVYYTNYDHEISNTITFTTTDKLNKLEQMLNRLFMPKNQDSNSNGLPDNAEPIKQAMDDIMGKMGGDAMNDVKDTISNAANDPYFTGGDERLNDIPKISINFMGIHADIFNVNNVKLIPYMKQIRELVMIFLVIGFIYAILSIFNIQWKV